MESGEKEKLTNINDSPESAAVPARIDTRIEAVDTIDKKSWNFNTMAVYNVIIRTGWIFKTESIIMPAVMDAMGGPGWLRGCLPMLNRFGQSVPPLLASSFVATTPLKKYVVAFCSAIMGTMFVAMSVFWYVTGGQGSWWLPGIFLLMYAIFFSSVGVNQLAVSTLIGKLIAVRRRGFLMLLATSLGSISAISCALILLRRWLKPDSANFVAIFLFAGLAFATGAVVAMFLRENRDRSAEPRINFRSIARAAVKVIRENRDFRILALVAAMFGMSMTLFPHYQALGRERLNLKLDSLLIWVIAQNLGMALFSIPAGRLADQFGNRLVLRLVMLAICAAPILALVLSNAGETGRQLYFLVFMLIGLTPVTMRVFANFTLELAPRVEQPKYLGILSLCMAGPAILTSTLLGLLLDRAGFETAFCVVICCLFIGWSGTIWLYEPRNAASELASDGSDSESS